MKASIVGKFHIGKNIMHKASALALLFCLLSAGPNPITLPANASPQAAQEFAGYTKDNYFAAVESGQIARLDAFKNYWQAEIASGKYPGYKFSVDFRDAEGNTPLMKAASAGKADVVRYLVSEGAVVDAQNSAGQTAAALAATNGHTQVVSYLQAVKPTYLPALASVPPVQAAPPAPVPTPTQVHSNPAGRAPTADTTTGYMARNAIPITLTVAGVGAAAVALAGSGGSGSKKKNSYPDNDYVILPPFHPSNYDHPQNGDPNDFINAESNEQAGFHQIESEYAHARGYDGRIYERTNYGTLIDNIPDGRVTVAVIDSGVDLDHPDLDANILTSKAVTCTDAAGCVAGGDDTDGHGTGVAGIIAAERNGTGIVGIAPEARIIPIAAIGIADGSDDKAFKYAAQNNAQVINASYGLGFGPLEIPIVTATTGDYTAPLNTVEFKMLDSLVIALRDVVKKDGIVVFAAGNGSMDQVGVLAGLPYYFRGNISDKPADYNKINPLNLNFKDHWVAVVSVDNTNTISPFSNHCGVAKEWCIAAPGQALDMTDIGGYQTNSGTSFAAPQVSGALAVLLGAFPHLNPEDVVRIMFETATDLGAPGVDDIYGHGLVNLDRATSPTDDGWEIALTSYYAGTSAAFEASRFSTSSAYGNAVSSAVEGKSLMFLDKYKRNFYVPAESLFSQNPRSSFAENKLEMFGRGTFSNSYAFGDNIRLGFDLEKDYDENFMNLDPKYSDDKLRRMSFTYNTGAVEANFNYNMKPSDAVGFAAFSGVDMQDSEVSQSFKNPYLGLSGNVTSTVLGYSPEGNLSFRFGAFEGDMDDYGLNLGNDRKVSGAYSEVSYTDSKNGFGVSLQTGYTNESETLLGAESGGAFDMGQDGKSYYAGLAAKYDVTNNLSFLANYNFGVSEMDSAKHSLISGMGKVYSDSFSFGAEYKDAISKNDAFRFAVSQPLRVMDGSAQLSLPQGILASGEVIYDRQNISLSPNGREIDLEGYYKVGLSAGSKLDLGGMVRFEPDHIEGAEPEGLLLMRYQQAF